MVLSAGWGIHQSEAAAPGIEILPSGDAEIDTALAQSLALPVLESRGETLESGEGARRAVLVREQARLTALVRSFGYLDGQVDIIAETSGSDGAPPAAFKVRTNLGPVFRVGAIQVMGIDDANLAPLASVIQAAIAETVGRPARADLLAALSDEILWQVQSASYPFVRIAKTDMSADPFLDLAYVVIGLDIGTPARFGSVHFSGDKGLDRQELQRAVPFAAGDAFDPARLDALAEAVRSLQRVRDVRIDLSNHASSDGLVQVDVRIRMASDPNVLAQDWLKGVFVLVAALAALAARQFLLAGGVRGNAPLILAVNGLIGVLVISGAALALMRAIAFAQFG